MKKRVYYMAKDNIGPLVCSKEEAIICDFVQYVDGNIICYLDVVHFSNVSKEIVGAFSLANYGIKIENHEE